MKISTKVFSIFSDFFYDFHILPKFDVYLNQLEAFQLCCFENVERKSL